MPPTNVLTPLALLKTSRLPMYIYLIFVLKPILLAFLAMPSSCFLRRGFSNRLILPVSAPVFAPIAPTSPHGIISPNNPIPERAVLATMSATENL